MDFSNPPHWFFPVCLLAIIFLLILIRGTLEDLLKETREIKAHILQTDVTDEIRGIGLDVGSIENSVRPKTPIDPRYG